MDFGEQIKNIRQKEKLTQEQFAMKLNVSRQAVSNWENNKNLPDIGMLILMSDVFQISLDYLIKGENEMNNMTEKVIKDAGDKIDEADKNDINQKIATLREAISGGNVDAMKLGTEDLQKAVYAVSEKLYKNQAGQANPADNTTPPAGDANGADGQVYDADF